MMHDPGERTPLCLAALVAALSAAVSAGCSGASSRDDAARPAPKSGPVVKRVREPAVAGLFYPKDPAALSQMLDRFLAMAHPEPIADLKGLVCPHAGYPFSGPTAAQAYALLAGRGYDTVIVLAPSHYARFRGAAVSVAEVFRTPLGDVPISEKAKALARVSPFVPEAPSPVQRPGWADQSSRSMPAAGQDTPDTWEHADEVQVPFLQRTLKNFQLIPVVLGEVDPEAVARALAGVIDDRTLLVASSDLSHYHPYPEAKELDARCVQAVCELDLDAMRVQEACGKSPILVLMHLARLKGWKARLLDCRNSGDTAGDKDRVVGYAAIAFHKPPTTGYSPAERKQLLELARQTLQEVVTRNALPTVQAEGFPPSLLATKGCFVTLTKHGQLRGCIGHLVPQEPLYKAVMDNARSAALQDFRFPPVKPAELGEIALEISVLTEPQPLVFSSPEDLLSKLQPHRDGVVLLIGDRRATYLPQVWEQLPDKAAFLNSLAQKAGCGPSDWRLPGTKVQIYHVESFHEGT